MCIVIQQSYRLKFDLPVYAVVKKLGENRHESIFTNVRIRKGPAHAKNKDTGSNVSSTQVGFHRFLDVETAAKYIRHGLWAPSVYPLVIIKNVVPAGVKIQEGVIEQCCVGSGLRSILVQKIILTHEEVN